MLSRHRNNPAPGASPAGGACSDTRAHRLERLIERFPPRLRQAVRWLRKPSSRWARIPAGVLLLIGGFLWILPLLGLWMLPLGLLLLAEDVPALDRLRERILESLERRYPHWFASLPEPRRIAAATSRHDVG